MYIVISATNNVSSFFFTNFVTVSSVKLFLCSRKTRRCTAYFSILSYLLQITFPVFFTNFVTVSSVKLFLCSRRTRRCTAYFSILSYLLLITFPNFLPQILLQFLQSNSFSAGEGPVGVLRQCVEWPGLRAHQRRPRAPLPGGDDAWAGVDAQTVPLQGRTRGQVAHSRKGKPVLTYYREDLWFLLFLYFPNLTVSINNLL